MGGKSSSRSSNTTSTTYNTEDGRYYVEQGGIGFGGKSNIDLRLTDGGAFDLTGQTLKRGTELTEQTLKRGTDLTAQTFKRGVDLVEKLSDRQTEIAQQVLEGSFALAKENTEDDAKEIAGVTIRSVLLGTTVLGALYLLRFLKK